MQADDLSERLFRCSGEWCEDEQGGGGRGCGAYGYSYWFPTLRKNA